MSQILNICFCSSVYFHEIKIYDFFFPFGNRKLRKRQKGVEGFQPLSVRKYFPWNVFAVAPWGKLVSNESVKYFTKSVKKADVLARKPPLLPAVIFF